MGSPASKCVNFPYFTDITRFTPGERGLGTLAPVIFGSCGRLHRDKGYDLALLALAGIQDRLRCDFRYRIVGEGPESQALKRMASDLGLSGQVEFLGWKDPQVLPDFYNELDILLHPSRTEPYGVGVLEGMATGRIVIASDRTAAGLDRIQDGENGFLHASDQAHALRDVILKVLALPQERRRSIEREARRTAELWPTSVGGRIISTLLDQLKPPVSEP